MKDLGPMLAILTMPAKDSFIAFFLEGIAESCQIKSLVPKIDTEANGNNVSLLRLEDGRETVGHYVVGSLVGLERFFSALEAEIIMDIEEE